MAITTIQNFYAASWHPSVRVDPELVEGVIENSTSSLTLTSSSILKSSGNHAKYDKILINDPILCPSKSISFYITLFISGLIVGGTLFPGLQTGRFTSVFTRG
jgi:hypothetical protein